jgi:GTP pyrophosphokinase
MVRFAECCNPIPGDHIIGFLTKGRGISVHRSDCQNVKIFEDDKERRIEVNWDSGEYKKYYVSMKISGADRSGLLHEISQVFAEFGANVSSGNIKAFNKRADLSFQIEIGNLNQLKQIFRQIEKIKGIDTVTRTKDYITYTQDFEDGSE